MKDFKFPKSITIEFPKIEQHWIKKHPLFISIKSFAKNKITDDKLWGGYDHHFDMLVIQDQKTVFTGDFLKNYNFIYKDLSAMEIRPIEFHYSLVEIELMTEEALTNWLNYLENSKNFFAYEEVLGSVDELKEKIRISGNSSIEYRKHFHRIRDLWESEIEEKEYTFEFERKR